MSPNAKGQLAWVLTFKLADLSDLLVGPCGDIVEFDVCTDQDVEGPLLGIPKGADGADWNTLKHQCVDNPFDSFLGDSLAKPDCVEGRVEQSFTGLLRDEFKWQPPQRSF